MWICTIDLCCLSTFRLCCLTLLYPQRPLLLARPPFGRSAEQDTHLLSVPLLTMSHEAHLQDPAATVPKPVSQVSANLSQPTTCLVVSDISSPAASLDSCVARNLCSTSSFAARCIGSVCHSHATIVAPRRQNYSSSIPGSYWEFGETQCGL